MKSKKRSKPRGRRSAASGGSANPPPTAILYRGPVRTRNDMGQNTAITRVLHGSGNLVTSSLGVISAVITNNPSPSPDWVNITPLWEEYRIIATELHWVPFYSTFNGLSTALAQGSMAVATSRNPTVGLPSTIASVLGYGDSRLLNTQKPFRITTRMDNVLEAGFTNIAVTGSTWAYVIYASNMTGSTPYGTWHLILRIQLRSQF